MNTYQVEFEYYEEILCVLVKSTTYFGALKKAVVIAEMFNEAEESKGVSIKKVELSKEVTNV